MFTANGFQYQSSFGKNGSQNKNNLKTGIARQVFRIHSFYSIICFQVLRSLNLQSTIRHEWHVLYNSFHVSKEDIDSFIAVSIKTCVLSIMLILQNISKKELLIISPAYITFRQ